MANVGQLDASPVHPIKHPKVAKLLEIAGLETGLYRFDTSSIKAGSQAERQERSDRWPSTTAWLSRG